jgi:hypothetical protein
VDVDDLEGQTNGRKRASSGRAEVVVVEQGVRGTVEDENGNENKRSAQSVWTVCYKDGRIDGYMVIDLRIRWDRGQRGGHQQQGSGTGTREEGALRMPL